MGRSRKSNETILWQEWKIVGNETLSRHAFCLWSSAKASFKVSLIFCSFLSKILTTSLWQSLPSRSWAPLVSLDFMPHTCPAQFHGSITNRFWQCWGWSNHSWCRGSTTTTTTTISSSAKLVPGPARHELTPASSQWLWLLSWHDSNHLSDRHRLVFLHHSHFVRFPGIFSTTWWSKVTQ